MITNSWNTIIWRLNCELLLHPCSTIAFIHFVTLLLHNKDAHVASVSCSHFISSWPLCHPSPTGTEQHRAFSPPPLLFSSPLHHLRLYFDAYVLFIHSSQIRSQEIRDICCTHFEDASCCSITCRAKVLFAFSGIGSAWLTGGGTPRACRLINKIFYVNATKERERWDH